MKRTPDLPVLELPRERYELSCGAILIVSRRADAPVTAVRVHVRGGSSLDPEGKEGLAYLTGSQVDQGTKRQTEEQLAARIEPAGGEFGGDANGFSGSIASVSWKLMCELTCEFVTEAAYPARAIERQKRRLLTRLRVEREDPRSQGAHRFRRLVYGSHWLGRPAYGTSDSVETIRAADLRRHHKKHWTGSRLVIAVCGDVQPRAVRNLFERSLSGLAPGSPRKPAPAVFPARATRVDVFRATRKQVHLYLGHLGVLRSEPDYPALAVMDHVLGTGPGFTNRISRRLRDELGLAYSVHADIHSSAGLLPGLFTAYIGTSPEHVDVALDGFLTEMRRIQDEPVTRAELEMVKSYLLGSFALGFERAARRASHLVACELHGFPEDHLARLPQAFAAVTIEDVQRAARSHLFPDACSLAASGPVTRKQLRSALQHATG